VIKRNKFLFLGAVLLSCLILGTIAFLGIGNDGFTERRILFIPKETPEKLKAISFQKDLPSLEVMLKQKFYYLGKGAQCYVFRSEDRQLVIKFFKGQHLQLPEWLEKIPLPKILDHYREESKQRKLERMLTSFESYQIAYNYLQRETGLLKIHLNPHLSPSSSIKIMLVDKQGKPHSIDLAQTCFILQKNVDELVYPYLDRFIKLGETDKVKYALLQIYNHILHNARKGIYNFDRAFGQNYGFSNGQLIQFDIGSFALTENANDPKWIKGEIKEATQELQWWLSQNSPDLYHWFYSELLESEPPLKDL
jgi:hypothetical protein